MAPSWQGFSFPIQVICIYHSSWKYPPPLWTILAPRAGRRRAAGPGFSKVWYTFLLYFWIQKVDLGFGFKGFCIFISFLLSRRPGARAGNLGPKRVK